MYVISMVIIKISIIICTNIFNYLISFTHIFETCDILSND